jgi:hypothetical protein
MKEEIKNNNRTIILCGRGRCCPKITHHNPDKENYITISDDYNGEVKLSLEEVEDLKTAISKLLDNSAR